MPRERERDAAAPWATPSHLARGGSEAEDGARLLRQAGRRHDGDGDGDGDGEGRGAAEEDDGDAQQRRAGPAAGRLEMKRMRAQSSDERDVESSGGIAAEDLDLEDEDEEASRLRAPKFGLFRRCGLVVFALTVSLVVLVLMPIGDGEEDALKPVPKLEGEDQDDGAPRYYFDVVSDPIAAPREGTNEITFGPFKVDSPLLVEAFTPLVDMSKVHHMVVYKSMTPTADHPIENSFWSIVGSGQNPSTMVVFAWARTGQETPMTFRAMPGSGVYLGPGTDAPYIYLDVHYELSTEGVQDRGNTKAGMRMVVKELEAATVSDWQDCDANAPETCPHEQGLGISLVHNSSFQLPPRKGDIDVIATCAVTQDAVLYAYRNHGHGEGRKWETELFRDGTYVGAIISRSVQDPQVFYELPEGGVPLRKGDVLKIHCHFDTSAATWITKPGPSLKRHQEMCNQYLMYYPHYYSGNKNGGLCVHRSALKNFAPARYREAPFDEDTSNELPAAPLLGQVSATAVSADGRTVYVLARRSNVFDSAKMITEDTIFVIQRTSGHVLRSFGANLFVTPHGLTCDGQGHLWVTDTHLHAVYRLDAKTGEVLQSIGTPGKTDYSASSFYAPTDVAVDDKRGEVFVADGYGHSRVAVFNYSSGAILREWGEKRGSAPGEFNIVHGIAFDPSRDWVYVADRENCRVQVFKREGELVTIWPSAGFCVKDGQLDPDDVYMGHMSAVAYSQRLDVVFSLEANVVVLRRAQTGEVVGTIRTGRKDRVMRWPHDIDVGLNAVKPFVYVAELAGNRTTRLSLA